MNALKSAGRQFLSRLNASGSRPPGERYYIYILCILVGIMIADLLILNFRDLMLPSKAPPARPERIESRMSVARSEYDSIISRNPFNSDGLIPDPIGSAGGHAQPENDPVPSSLPLTLVGTLVHVNPKKSVATINISSSNKILSYQVGDDVEGLARITKIERQKVVFRNSNNNRLEYVEIKREVGLSIGVSKSAPAAGSSEIQIEGNNVTVKRSEVLKQTANLADVLNQASAVPNFVPGSGGKINGYRLVNIAPGSIYEKLGLRRFDVIKGVNGEPVDSPARAMELYNQLKNSNGIALQIERNGADETLNFSVTE